MNALRVALGINSGNSIFIVAFVALCGALQTHFLRRGVRNELPRLKPVGFASSPKGDGKPSQPAPTGRVQLPRRGSFGYLPVSTKSSPFGRAGAGAPERVQPAEGWQNLFPQRRAFAESGTANVISRYDPSREMGISERPQAFRYPEI